METLLDEHYRLKQQLSELEAENTSRNLLIHLCTLKVLALHQKDAPQTQAAPNTDTKDLETEKKLLDYELRVSVLKLQLSTKEKLHEAQIDELKDLVAELRKKLDEATAAAPKTRAVSGSSLAMSRSSILSPPNSSGRLGERSVSAGSTFLSPNQSMFSGASPIFKKKRSGNAAPRIDFGVSSLVSQASLKLSQTEKKAGFSPANSSVESTPSKPETDDAERGTGEEVAEDGQGTANREKHEQKGESRIQNSETADTEETNRQSEKLPESSMATDTEDETFHSANNTLSERKKKKKIQLLAAEASTTIFPQATDLGVEDEDMNSLNYYNDENFKEDTSSPLRPAKRKRESPESEAPQKKRHVFKI